MRFISTRSEDYASPSQTVVTGLAPLGGLFVPEYFPTISMDEIIGLNYEQLAVRVLSLYLDDFTESELNDAVYSAYADKFGSPVAPVKRIDERVSMLELWHGPTLAFKDVALQLLPRLMTLASQKTSEKREILILTATSGDTGKAALEGFRDVPGVKIAVFYPRDGVSKMQRLQMVTQEGKNVFVCAVNGNFDDAQTGVKRIFTDAQFTAKADGLGYTLSSANSINVGRLLPQVVYYLWSYAALVRYGLKLGKKVNIVVPTGNFGNILAAYYAMRMGLPINRLICASNSNNVLTDFINTGRYDAGRTFYKTISPSMDILVSSNLERMLFELADRKPQVVQKWMGSLKSGGCFSIAPSMVAKLQQTFSAGYCDDAKTMEYMRLLYEATGYVMDPHTAVGYGVYSQYAHDTEDATETIIAATASPFKFCPDVVKALFGERTDDAFAAAKLLSRRTGLAIPPQIGELERKPERFTGSCEASEMGGVLLDWLAKK